MDIKQATNTTNMIITSEMLFTEQVQQIIRRIEAGWGKQIQNDFDTYPDIYPDILTWMETHPEVVGRAFMEHIINYGLTNEDIN